MRIVQGSFHGALAFLIMALISLKTGVAAAAEPTKQELLERINSLQSQLDEVKSHQQVRTENPRDADAVTEAVLKDAQQRSQLLAMEGFTAGYTDGKFILRSADGAFLLHPWAQFQFREVTNYREDVKTNGGNDLESGFEVRRLKVGVDGNLFGPDLTYNFVWATDRHNGTPALEYAYAQYHLPNTPFSIRMGQFKDPLDHEQITSTKYTAAVDRTLVDDLFANGEGYIQGVSFIYVNARDIRAEGALTDGLRSANTNFQDFPATGIPANWGVAGRVEYKFFGKWSEYDKLAAYGQKSELLVLGAGADYTEAGHTDAFTHVIDAQYGNGKGLGLYGAYLGRYTKGNTVGVVTSDTYDWTLRGQASYVINQRWEPFVQLEYIHFDDSGLVAGSVNNVPVFRVGTSYFLYGQAARLQLDLSYLPKGSPVNDDGAGILQDNDNHELVLRAQFQLLL